MENHEILDEKLREEEIIPPKNNRKIKIFVAIIISILFVSINVILLGHFKFNWFKSEIYNLDIQISRNIGQINYFTETKILKSRLGYTSGEFESKEIIIKNNFIVIQTSKEKLNNYYLNTATLIILDVKVKMENEENQGISFNIFDKEKVKEFMANPEGTKYPFAIFSFYENGTISNINLPDNMNKSIAISMINLIEQIIPKLNRNRTEDYLNGLEFNIKKNKTLKTLVENYSQREIKDIKNSKFFKFIERDIENGQLTNIRTHSNISLETQANNEEITLGLKDYFIHEKGEIILKEIKKEKENIELIQKLSKYYNFINSQDLLKSFEKNENEKKENVVEKIEINNSSSILRNLRFFSFDKTFTVRTFNVFGISGSIKIRIYVQRLFRIYECRAEIIISSTAGEVKFGNELPIGFSKTFQTPEYRIFFFNFPHYMFAGVGLNAQGSLKILAKLIYNPRRKTGFIRVEFTGSLRAKAYVWATVFVAELTGGAWGTIVELNLGGNINPSGEINRFGSLGAGEVVVFIEGKMLSFMPKFYHQCKVFDGWRRDF